MFVGRVTCASCGHSCWHRLRRGYGFDRWNSTIFCREHTTFTVIRCLHPMVESVTDEDPTSTNLKCGCMNSSCHSARSAELYPQQPRGRIQACSVFFAHNASRIWCFSISIRAPAVTGSLASASTAHFTHLILCFYVLVACCT